MTRLARLIVATFALVFIAAGAGAQTQAPAPAEIKIGYLR